jgi:hypothetical protein
MQLLFLAAGLGVKTEVSTAFGMTDTSDGGMLARSTVFSLEVCDTQMTWLMMLHVKLSTLFMWIALGSLNPNSE